MKSHFNAMYTSSFSNTITRRKWRSHCFTSCTYRFVTDFAMGTRS